MSKNFILAVHSRAHKVVSHLGSLSQDPAAVGREGVRRVEQEVVLGLLENGQPFRRRGDVSGHVSPVILGDVIPGYLIAVVLFPALASGTGLLVRNELESSFKTNLQLRHVGMYVIQDHDP